MNWLTEKNVEKKLLQNKRRKKIKDREYNQGKSKQMENEPRRRKVKQGREQRKGGGMNKWRNKWRKEEVKREISGVCVYSCDNERGRGEKKGGRRGMEKCFDLSTMTNGEPELTLLLLHVRHTQTHVANPNTHTNTHTHTQTHTHTHHHS